MKGPTRSEIAEILASTSLFGHIPEKDLDDLVSGTKYHHFEAGELVFSRYSEATSVEYVLEGRLKASVTGRVGNDLLLGVVDRGEFCGLLGILDHGMRRIDARATSATSTLSIDRLALLRVFNRNATSAMKLVEIFQQYVRDAIANVETLGLDRAEVRLWTRLMELGQRYGQVEPESGAVEIKHGLSQQELADSVGLTRVMVNRQLSSWRDQGLISANPRGVVRIPDPKALETRVRKSGA